jgi:ABC-type multidrug transport system fused ATPase/permease subunit
MYRMELFIKLKDNMIERLLLKLGSRKFLMSMLIFAVAIVLVVTGKITSGDFVSLVKWLTIVYFSANSIIHLINGFTNTAVPEGEEKQGVGFRPPN